MDTSINPQAAPLYQQLPVTTRPWEIGPIAGNPFPVSTFPAGHFIDGLGTVIPPTTPIRVMGGLGN